MKHFYSQGIIVLANVKEEETDMTQQTTMQMNMAMMNGMMHMCRMFVCLKNQI